MCNYTYIYIEYVCVCVQQSHAVLPCFTDELQSDHYIELVVTEAALRSGSVGRLFTVDSVR